MMRTAGLENEPWNNSERERFKRKRPPGRTVEFNGWDSFRAREAKHLSKQSGPARPAERMAQKAAIPVPALVQWRTRRCWLPAGSRSFCFRPWGLEIQAANASITIRQQDMPFLLGNAAACRKSPSAAAFSSRVRFPLLANIGAVRWPRAALAFARVCGVDGETDQASAPLMRSAVSKSRLWKRRRGFGLSSANFSKGVH